MIERALEVIKKSPQPSRGFDTADYRKSEPPVIAPRRPPQFSLRWLFTRMATVSAICATTIWWVNYVRRVEEANLGIVPLRTVHVTIFLAILLLSVVVTVILVPPMCIAVAMFWPRRRTNKKDTRVSE